MKRLKIHVQDLENYTETPKLFKIKLGVPGNLFDS